MAKQRKPLISAKFKEQAKELFGSMKIILNYIITDIIKRPRSFKIGVFSIFIVVGFLTILQAGLELVPIVFIKLAENNSGDVDLTFTPIAAENDTRRADATDDTFFIRALNTSDIRERLADLDDIQSITSRWLLPVKISNPEDESIEYSAILLVLNSESERLQGVGRNLDVPDLAPGEAWITENVRRLLDIQKFENVQVRIDVIGQLNSANVFQIGQNASFTEDGIQEVVADLIDQFLESNGFQNGTLDLDGLVEPEVVNSTVDAVIALIPLFTNDDGTLDEELFEILLQSQDINITLPEGALDGVTAEEIEDTLLDLQDALNGDTDADLNVDPVALSEQLAPVVISALNITQQFNVTSAVDDPSGKWPGELGNVIAIDSKFILPIIEQGIRDALDEFEPDTGNPALDSLIEIGLQADQVNDALDAVFQGNATLEDFALTVNIMFKNRVELYQSQSEVQPNLIRRSNAIFQRLGKDYPAQVTAPLQQILDGLFLFKNFLDNVFNGTVFILFLLAVLLIYSLMISNVEEKTYEFGMLRALGLRSNNLIMLLSFQSAFYAIPGLTLGMILAFAINSAVSFWIFNYTMLVTSYALPSSAVGLGFLLATVIPFISNVFPIKRALSKTLRDSLNIYHRVISDITVRIYKLAKLGISSAQMIGSIMLIVIGLISYYLAPYALIYQNFSLFFFLLNLILMLMLIGLTLLINLVQPYFERLINAIIFLCNKNDKPLQALISKNFDAHRKRNQKTALMFSIALAFLIFSGSGLSLQANLISDQVKVLLGSDLAVRSPPFGNVILDEKSIRDALDEYIDNNPNVIRGFSFTSFPMTQQPEFGDAELAPLAGDPDRNVEIYSVDEDYLASIYDEFYLPIGYDSTISFPEDPRIGKRDGIAGLYNDEGLQTISELDKFNITTNEFYRTDIDLGNLIGKKEMRFVIPLGLATDASVPVGTPALLKLGSLRFRARIRHTAQKMPGFFFTGYQSFFRQPIITSHADYAYIRDLYYNYRKQDSRRAENIQEYNESLPEGATYNVPKLWLQLQMVDNTNEDKRLEIFNLLQTLIDGDLIFVVDVQGSVESVQSTLVFIDIFFIAVAAIAISLSFFFTIISFVSTIKENSWEFGVLRAIGLNKKQMNKIYIFEALSLIISAGILGTFVGLFMSFIQTYQFNLFTELPFRLLFPTALFIFTIIASIITAVFGSRAAIKDIENKQISTIIKALD